MDQHEQVLARIDSGFTRTDTSTAKTHDLLGEIVQALGVLTTAFKYSAENNSSTKEKENSWGIIAACGGIIFGVMAPMYFSLSGVSANIEVMATEMRTDNQREADDSGLFATLFEKSRNSEKRIDLLTDIIEQQHITRHIRIQDEVRLKKEE
jgi:hypothetical protein